MMDVARHVELLRAGGVVACPTESQMGLFADARSAAAVERVCRMKHRPPSEALPLVVPSIEVASEIAGPLSPLALRLAEAHWPGPLTLVLRARVELPEAVTRGGTVALRIPGPSPAAELVAAFGGALTATSANLSGEPPLSDANALLMTFGTTLSAIVPGPVPGGPPSTLVDLSGKEPRVLRQGSVKIDV